MLKFHQLHGELATNNKILGTLKYPQENGSTPIHKLLDKPTMFYLLTLSSDESKKPMLNDKSKSHKAIYMLFLQSSKKKINETIFRLGMYPTMIKLLKTARRDKQNSGQWLKEEAESKRRAETGLIALLACFKIYIFHVAYDQMLD